MGIPNLLDVPPNHLSYRCIRVGLVQLSQIKAGNGPVEGIPLMGTQLGVNCVNRRSVLLLRAVSDQLPVYWTAAGGN